MSYIHTQILAFSSVVVEVPHCLLLFYSPCLFSWIIGLCVGVPCIVLLVVFIIVTYCVCVRYRNKRMEAAMSSYRRNRRGSDTAVVDAPPAYTPLSGDTEDPGEMLPSYTTADPFPNLKPVDDEEEEEGGGGSRLVSNRSPQVEQALQQQQQVGGGAGSGDENTAETSHVTSEGGSQVSSEDSHMTAEDAPLIEGDN